MSSLRRSTILIDMGISAFIGMMLPRGSSVFELRDAANMPEGSCTDQARHVYTDWKY